MDLRRRLEQLRARARTKRKTAVKRGKTDEVEEFAEYERLLDRLSKLIR